MHAAARSLPVQIYRCSQPEKSQDEQKSAKKRQPVVKPAVQETFDATVPLGYEEMLAG